MINHHFCCIFEPILNSTTMKKYIFRIQIIFLALLLVFISCGEDEPQVNTKRTILVYMVASNTLASCDEDDVNEIITSISQNGTNNCRLLIYWVTKGTDPKLIEIKKKDSSAISVVHKRYSSDIRSTTKERMQEVIHDVQLIAPADDYGLILWSHASGWASSLTARTIAPVPFDFGDDYGATMPIDILADALPYDVFTFVYTDACYMAGVEVVYELKDKIKYFIGSVTELPADGMDYFNNIPLFFADSLNLIGCCENTFNKYNSLKGSSRTCTISLTDCSKLGELAAVCNEIHRNEIGNIPTSNIQRYKNISPYLFYDFVQYTSLLATDEQKKRLDDLMRDVVLYKNATPYIFNQLSINETNYSGLSTYIMGTTQSSGVNEIYYKTLDWYNDVIM